MRKKLSEIAFHRMKPVVGFNEETGEVREYKSLIDVKKDGFHPVHVSECCRKLKGFKSHKGFKWVFKEEYINNIFKEVQ